MTEFRQTALDSFIDRLRQYVETEQFKGWDPYDALRSPFLEALTRPSALLQRCAIHGVRLLPWNVRPWLGIGKSANETALSVFCRAYLNLYCMTGRSHYLHTCEKLINRLRELSCVNNAKYLGWSRDFRYVAGSEVHEVGKPLSFLGTIIGETFLEYSQLSGTSPLDAEVERIIRAILRYGGVYETSKGTFIGYAAVARPRLIFNVNALAAALFLRYCRTRGSSVRLENHDLVQLSERLIRTVLKHQQGNGSWLYGFSHDGESFRLIDFHQGFVVDAIGDILTLLADHPLSDRLRHAYARGLAFMAREQIDGGGACKWRYPRARPYDIHNQAQGIISLSRAPGSAYDDLLDRMLGFTLRHFWDDQGGYFIYQVGRYWRNEIPYMRWAQAWMMLALTEYRKRTQCAGSWGR